MADDRRFFARRALARRSLEKGLVLSALIHMSLLGAYRAACDRAAPREAAEPRGRPIRARTVGVTVVLARPVAPGARPQQSLVPYPGRGPIIPVERLDHSWHFFGGVPGPVTEGPAEGSNILAGPGEPSGDPPEEPSGFFRPVDVPPVPIDSPRPGYPEWAREASIQGTVLLHVLVGTDGRVKRVIVIRGVRGLDEEAAKVVRRWVFRPALSNGIPVQVWVEVPVAFRL